jgi:hypothetical protein
MNAKGDKLMIRREQEKEKWQDVEGNEKEYFWKRTTNVFEIILNDEIHDRANEIMNFVDYLVTAINEEFQDQIMNISSLIDNLRFEKMVQMRLKTVQ